MNKKNNKSNGSNGTGRAERAPPKAGEPTGRYIVAFRDDVFAEGIAALTEATGLSVFSAGDASSEDAENGAIVFDKLGVAVLDAPPEQAQQLMLMASEGSSPFLAVEPERYVEAFSELELEPASELHEDAPVSHEGQPANELREGEEQNAERQNDESQNDDAQNDRSRIDRSQDEEAPSGELTVHAEYLAGYRDSVVALVDRLLAKSKGEAKPGSPSIELPSATSWNESQFTWGLQATRTQATTATGAGIRVAILDTGFGPHSDFTGRAIVMRSFVTGQTPADGNGHGTHCTGTSCGPVAPGKKPRYGIASRASIYVGKVLSNAGSGRDADILAGINWAVENRCAIVSMSLGRPTVIGERYSTVYETAAKRALARGTLIIAAAGNESKRSLGRIAPVSAPANCPSIMAVAALTEELTVADFSCGARNGSGGEVNIAAPGVGVYSSIPRSPFYGRKSGTSMATPHVAGIAALYAQRTGARGAALWRLLLSTARRLSAPASDVGAGLAQYSPTARPSDE